MLKAYSWWDYKVPPMLAVVFYALYRSPDLQKWSTTLWQIGLFLISVIGIAGFGHFFLDAFDVEEDKLAGKANLWANAGTGSRLALTVGLLAASWMPWLILPRNIYVLSLIALEFVVFALYAVPPVRLKTRGFPGIIADASYAHVLPILWSWCGFAAIAGISFSPGFMILVAAWALVVGVRHLMQHQALEAADDAAAGTLTFAVRHGAEKTFALAGNVLIPIEVVALALLLLRVGIDLPALGIGFIAYAAFEIFRFRVLWLQRLRLMDLAPADKTTIVGTLVLSQFYELWFPVIVLAALVVRSPSYVIVFVIYLVLFRNGPAQLIRRDLPQVRLWLRGREGKHHREVMELSTAR